jgi:hypothetical protein
VAAALALVGLYEWLSGRSFRSLGARWDAMGPSVTDALGVAIVGILLGGCALAFWRLMGS